MKSFKSLGIVIASIFAFTTLPGCGDTQDSVASKEGKKALKSALKGFEVVDLKALETQALMFVKIPDSRFFTSSLHLLPT